MDLSIVIATRDRAALLTRTLDSLAPSADRAPARFEVVVADHGSTDETAEVIAERADRLPVRRLPVAFDGPSIAVPKNAGAAAAQGEVLVFLDSGMVCAEGFVAAHARAHRATAAACVAGSVYGWDSEDEDDPIWADLAKDPQPERIPDRLADPRDGRWAEFGELTWLGVWGANFSVRRADFQRAGGFDAGMRGWGWDDTELAFRLTRHGVTPVFDADAWAVHLPHPRSPLQQRMRTAQRNWLRAYQRHQSPELELWDACDYWSSGTCFRRLAEAAATWPGRFPEPPPRIDDAQRRVLFGYGVPQHPHPRDVYVLPPGTEDQLAWRDGDHVVAYGLRTPLPDHAAEVAIVSPGVLDLDWSPSPGRSPLGLRIMREAARVARRVQSGDPAGLDDAAARRLTALPEQAAQLDARIARFYHGETTP